ncbi:sigma-70 family RNA polymerase sigma factor [Agromyces kandeliae]|uniref:Sigma-70 family RNA polymerase sigma factor n=1 Tax=Agromyces kandeliae TaxID=2666141 RepID=A0A6L5R3D0_9MICO|nr:sigma-70 family RNA polymerase sigma factor [Agromyces kandeliae]MRX44490.1 sigma-70 family RNA polymerase sigma factor [Agromyces kandeliae]
MTDDPGRAADDGTAERARDDLADVVDERRRLLALTYRMLGTTGEAEDAVQETYVRWYRMSDAERAAIANPQGWLTRVAGRVCLDLLGTARARRERYVGPWLPEPLPAGFFAAGTGAAATSAATASAGVGDGSVTAQADDAADPLDRVTLDEAVSSALLVVLEAMTPPERVSFVLHDVFAVPFPEIAEIVGRSPAAVRQLATSARRRVAAERSRQVSRAEHDAVVAAFAAAAQAGDLAALTRVLDPDVTLRSDGGGLVSAARKPVLGAENVARFLLGLLAKNPDDRVEPTATTDGTGFAVVRGDALIGIVNLNVVAGHVADVWIVMNPEKLGAWRD